MFNSVSKNWVAFEGYGSSSRTTTPSTHKKHSGMVQKETLDCSGNHIHNLWRELETVVGAVHPSNIKELEQFAALEWAILPVE
jgi:hypothetical protein